ncbi:MAG TPA: peptidoglycan DD-metalloendopeptidase family protein [Xanthobacteraceae bacterium]
MGYALPAIAQQPLRITPQAAEQPASPTDKAARERELDRVRAEQRKAAETEAKLAAEITALGQDRRQLTRSLIETAGRLQETEGRVASVEARLKELDGKETGIRTALDARRGTIAELLAALQRIGRRPPPAMLVKPEDALEAVRSAIMLGAVVPEMRAEAEILSRNLADLVRIRGESAAERETLAAELARFADERQRMALLVEERQKRQTEAEKALDGERVRARELARQAETLKDLVAKLEQDALVTGRAVPTLPGDRRPETLRLSPAIAFAAAKGALPLPVKGVKVRDFGSTDSAGGIEKGLSVAARSGAQVTAPCDGSVVYAGPFRSYGQLLILNAGGGYHVLLAGMERISVDLGQFVLTGEPVAVMGNEPKLAAAAATGASQPILYIEFRKDGTPIDPGPWWAANHSEKVRG